MRSVRSGVVDVGIVEPGDVELGQAVVSVA
jgi:hypothetical protein